MRLRKAARKKAVKVFAISAFADRALGKMAGTLLPTVPGGEAVILDELHQDPRHAELRELLGAPGAVVLAGERLAASAGALSAVTRLIVLIVAPRAPASVVASTTRQPVFLSGSPARRRRSST